MNKKGQALVEFVLILPVFLFLILAVYDFGMIFNKKNMLENISHDVSELYQNGKALDQIVILYPDIDITITTDNNYNEIKVSDKLKIWTPGLNRVLGNPYIIEVKRYIPNE